MDNRSIEEIIVDATNKADIVNKKTTNSSNDDNDLGLHLEYPENNKDDM